MNIMIMDDEELALRGAQDVVARLCPDSTIRLFQFPIDALEHLTKERVDVVFLDIEMPGIHGLELAQRIKLCQPKANIIFLTGYSQYALDAHELYVSGVLLKPVTEEKVRRALENLRHPPELLTKRVRVQTFGNFELFLDGKPVHFSRARSKEVLAYLVDRRGATSSLAEISAVLFEDRPDSQPIRRQVQTFIQQLMSDLKSVGLDDLVIKQRNSFAVDPQRFECDLYEFLDLRPSGVNAYHGEYMSNYSWAEFTNGQLNR